MAGVWLQGAADDVGLERHDSRYGEVQASLQIGAHARQLIMETVIHLQVLHSSGL